MMQKRIRYLTDWNYRKIIQMNEGKYNNLSDEEFIKLKFKATMNRELDLDNPVTFNEKLQWLKLHDRKPIYTQLVDKAEVKRYVAEKIGEQYIIPTIGIWDHFDDIDFSQLPDQFVLKCTHDSGGLVICKDKKTLDLSFAKNKIEKSLHRNYYHYGREWPYKNVKPRIIAEKYMEDKETKELRDYKYFCFDGKAKMMFIATNRQGEGDTYFDFFDINGRHLPFTQGHPNAPIKPSIPHNHQKIIELAEKLSGGMPQVRIDFYEANGEIYFGEITFYHFSGFTPFVPNKWDEELGKLINIPTI